MIVNTSFKLGQIRLNKPRLAVKMTCCQVELFSSGVLMFCDGTQMGLCKIVAERIREMVELYKMATITSSKQTFKQPLYHIFNKRIKHLDWSNTYIIKSYFISYNSTPLPQYSTSTKFCHVIECIFSNIDRTRSGNTALREKIWSEHWRFHRFLAIYIS